MTYTVKKKNAEGIEMIDIVNGLRRIAEEGYRFAGDAADEIERLRADKATLQQMMYSLKDPLHIVQQLVRSEMDKQDISEAHKAVTSRLSALADENVNLRAKISDLTINVEYLGNLKKSYEELIGELQEERDELRAKIEQMEKQKPFAWIVRGGYPVPLDKLEWQLWCGSEKPTLSWVDQEMRPLYALPGAKGE